MHCLRLNGFVLVAICLVKSVYSEETLEYFTGTPDESVQKCRNGTGNDLGVAINPIVGTSLCTGTYYKLGLLQFPNGVVTWADKKTSSGLGRYVQIDNDLTRTNRYSSGGIWYLDTQWMFVPVKYQYGYYQLVNRGRPGLVAMWSTKEKVGEGGYFMTLEPDPGRRVRDTLFKLLPVPSSDARPGIFFQLTNRSLRKSLLSFTAQRYGDKSRYIYLENGDHWTGQIDEMETYLPDNFQYAETLFIITPVEEPVEEHHVNFDDEEDV